MDSESKRLSAVDLLGNLFTQPGSSDISKDYAELFQDLLKRLHDQKVMIICTASYESMQLYLELQEDNLVDEGGSMSCC